MIKKINTFLIVTSPVALFTLEVPEDKIIKSSYYNPIDWVCYWAARKIAFSDITNEEVKFICANGHELKYKGWQPNMIYEFIDTTTNETVWKEIFPEWEH